MSIIDQRIEALRNAMEESNLDVLIIPSSDPHQSEYVCDHWKSREYFSGFSGSSGTLVIGKEEAALWTDSRYFIQAEEELKGSSVQLQKQSIPHAPEHVPWLNDQLKKGSIIGLEGLLFSANQITMMQSTFQQNDHQLKNVDGIVSQVWKDRPKMPNSLVYEHALSFAGKSRLDKLNEVRESMKKDGSQFYFISVLDEIAWLLNLRAWDIEFTPVALAYVILGLEDIQLYIDKSRMDYSLLIALENNGVTVKAYDEILDDLSFIRSNSRLYLDEGAISWTFLKSIKAEKSLGSSLINPLQAIKNPIEIKHIENAMIKDGVALLKFFKWLEENHLDQELTEFDLSQKIAHFRSGQEDYVGESFAAIVGFKGNGAIVHYGPDEEGSALIESEGMLLIDSGGQYLDGTTDITRTIYLGKPSEEHRQNFTLVLKGNIALQNIQFPKGTVGMQLSTLARMHLWNEGLNYGHGTGHGVGFFLRVHEPPQGFATSGITSRGTTVHLPGMLTSNEPGFYKEGEYGIRIENLMFCEESISNSFGQFLKFKALTLFPISTRLIEKAMLVEQEINWLNNYHQKVFDLLSPNLNTEEKNWLKKQCEPI